MRTPLLSAAAILLTGCFSPFWGGQSGAEATSGQECLQLGRADADDDLTPEGWNEDVAALRGVLDSSWLVTWWSPGTNPVDVTLIVEVEGPAEVIEREPNGDDSLCPDLVLLDGTLTFEGAVQGSVPVRLSSTGVLQTEVDLATASEVQIPVAPPSEADELEVSGVLEADQVFLSFTWFDGDERRVAGQISSD